MKARTYVILERAIEEGYKRGWNRAHKHADSPTPAHIEEEVLKNVMDAISEVFVFEDPEL